MIKFKPWQERVSKAAPSLLSDYFNGYSPHSPAKACDKDILESHFLDSAHILQNTHVFCISVRLKNQDICQPQVETCQ